MVKLERDLERTRENKSIVLAREQRGGAVNLAEGRPCHGVLLGRRTAPGWGVLNCQGLLLASVKDRA